ncbi:MAG TPA: hypothetical protein PKJ33_00145 [Alphaproteobacteria bacterium]|nr:hypothetical protein [Alphaproteobacteria bacterium]
MTLLESNASTAEIVGFGAFLFALIVAGGYAAKKIGEAATKKRNNYADYINGNKQR